jgi:hypothetical protein
MVEFLNLLEEGKNAMDSMVVIPMRFWLSRK